ncbi:MAG: hypothetical protein WCC17_16840 [Candidatus Nitrosopolaris sp.]
MEYKTLADEMKLEYIATILKFKEDAYIKRDTKIVLVSDNYIYFKSNINISLLIVALKDSSSASSASREEHKLLKEIAILSSIFVGLMILAIRPFGFRTFLHGLGHDNVFSLLLVASAGPKNRLDFSRCNRKGRKSIIT